MDPAKQFLPLGFGRFVHFQRSLGRRLLREIRESSFQSHLVRAELLFKKHQEVEFLFFRQTVVRNKEIPGHRHAGGLPSSGEERFGKPYAFLVPCRGGRTAAGQPTDALRARMEQVAQEASIPLPGLMMATGRLLAVSEKARMGWGGDNLQGDLPRGKTWFESSVGT